MRGRVSSTSLNLHGRMAEGMSVGRGERDVLEPFRNKKNGNGGEVGGRQESPTEPLVK